VEAAKSLGVSRGVALLKPHRCEPFGHHYQFAADVFLSEHADARNILVALDAYHPCFISGFPNIAIYLQDGQSEALGDCLQSWPDAPKEWGPILLGDKRAHWTGESLKILIKAGAKLHPGAWKLILKKGDFPLFEEHVAALIEVGALSLTAKFGRDSFIVHVFRSLHVVKIPPDQRRPFLKLLLDLDADPAPLLDKSLEAFVTPDERTLLSKALEARVKRYGRDTPPNLSLETELDLA
jgi:hypothetical protein